MSKTGRSKTRKNLVFKTNKDPLLIKKIIEFLKKWSELEPNQKTTFLGVARGVGLNPEDRKNWLKLRLHSMYLEQKGIIEERHFSDPDCPGQVDYFLKLTKQKNFQ